MNLSSAFSSCDRCSYDVSLDRQVPLPAGPGPDRGRGRQEGAQYKENTLPGSHALPGVELPFYPVFPYSS